MTAVDVRVAAATWWNVEREAALGLLLLEERTESVVALACGVGVETARVASRSADRSRAATRTEHASLGEAPASLAPAKPGAVAGERLAALEADQLDGRVLLRLVPATAAAVAGRRLIAPLTVEPREVLGELGAVEQDHLAAVRVRQPPVAQTRAELLAAVAPHLAVRALEEDLGAEPGLSHRLLARDLVRAAGA